MKKAALLSVSNQDGLVDFARGLKDLGLVLLATSGTRKSLEAKGIETLSIEEYTGQKEILDGRVKTLHPKIHAGLLARRDDPKHMQQLKEDEILQIDVVAVNLYPFIENLKTDNVDNPSKMIELVDIGGPTMLRAAAKNYQSIYTAIDPKDYKGVLEYLSGKEEGSEHFRLELATKVFASLADYNLQIAKYFSNVKGSEVDKANDFNLGSVTGRVLFKQQDLRYGENPHQKAAFYSDLNPSTKAWEQLNGKKLSYNNFLDADAAIKLIKALPPDKKCATIVKHLNPCGAAVSDNAVEALQKAKKGDPRSHFGGIIAINTEVVAEVAENICQDFAEIVVAPDYAPEALALLQKKKNLRVLKIDLEDSVIFESRSIQCGVLVQESDISISDLKTAELVTKRKLSEHEMVDLQLAWHLCANVKSNAISLVKDGTLLAVGAGQMSRIDSVELAISKANTHGHELKGAVAASDAFFPFTDNVETLAQNGIVAVVAPKGAKRDDEVVATADKLGISLLFVSDRHFRH